MTASLTEERQRKAVSPYCVRGKRRYRGNKETGRRYNPAVYEKYRKEFPTEIDFDTRREVPPDVQAEHDYAFSNSQQRSLTQLLLGDPLPGRSALDRESV